MTLGEFIFLTIFFVIALLIIISTFSYKLVEYSDDYGNYYNSYMYEYLGSALGYSLVFLAVEFLIAFMIGAMCSFDFYIFGAGIEYIKSDIFRAMAIISLLIILFIKEIFFQKNCVREIKKLKKITKEAKSINNALSGLKKDLSEVHAKLDKKKQLSENLISELENNEYVFKKQEETLLIRLTQLQNMKVMLEIKINNKHKGGHSDWDY